LGLKHLYINGVITLLITCQGPTLCGNQLVISFQEMPEGSLGSLFALAKEV